MMQAKQNSLYALALTGLVNGDVACTALGRVSFTIVLACYQPPPIPEKLSRAATISNRGVQ